MVSLNNLLSASYDPSVHHRSASGMFLIDSGCAWCLVPSSTCMTGHVVDDAAVFEKPVCDHSMISLPYSLSDCPLTVLDA